MMSTVFLKETALTNDISADTITQTLAAHRAQPFEFFLSSCLLLCHQTLTSQIMSAFPKKKLWTRYMINTL